MRVLFLTPWYPTPDAPSWGIFVREHARSVARYCDVAVLHTMGPTEVAGSGWMLSREEDSVLTAGLATYRTTSHLSSSAVLTYARYTYGLFRAVLALRQNGFRADIIHAHGYDPGFPAALIGRVLGTPLVISEHYSAFPLGTLTPRQLRRARLAFRWADRVMPVSHALEDAIRRLDIHGSFEVVTNTVDTDLFFPPEEDSQPGSPHRFLFVGRMDPIKGVSTLLEGVAQLRDHPREWRMDLVGHGPAIGALQEQTTDLAIADRVTFHGLKNKGEIARMMRRADALVLPSQWDNAPCVVIEAMASGLPVIASRVGGIPELVDAEVGELVPPGAVPELTSALRRSIERVVAYDRAAIAERGRSFSLEAVGSRFHDIYRRVAGHEVED